MQILAVSIDANSDCIDQGIDANSGCVDQGIDATIANSGCTANQGRSGDRCNYCKFWLYRQGIDANSGCTANQC